MTACDLKRLRDDTRSVKRSSFDLKFRFPTEKINRRARQISRRSDAVRAVTDATIDVERK